MLVLTRRVDEEIYIDKGRIIIKVLRKRNGAVAFGITAPTNVDVERKEIFFRKLENPMVKNNDQKINIAAKVIAEVLL